MIWWENFMDMNFNDIDDIISFFNIKHSLFSTVSFLQVNPVPNSDSRSKNESKSDEYPIADLKKQGAFRNSSVWLGVTRLWHVAQWVSRAPPYHTLPAFLNLDCRSSNYPRFFIINFKYNHQKIKFSATANLRQSQLGHDCEQLCPRAQKMLGYSKVQKLKI